MHALEPFCDRIGLSVAAHPTELQHAVPQLECEFRIFSGLGAVMDCAYCDGLSFSAFHVLCFPRRYSRFLQWPIPAGKFI
jgi:hypothetical protein